jgi:SpoVK/Ycf46/Vps4 family AAA+-type ATPase
MEPEFLNKMKGAIECHQHMILSLNTEDWQHSLQDGVSPSALRFFLARVFNRDGYRVAYYAPSQGLQELTPPDRAGASGQGGNVQSRGNARLAEAGDPLQALNAVNRLLRNADEKWLVLIDYAESLAPATPGGAARSAESAPLAEVIHTMALDDAIASGSSRMALITYTGAVDDLLMRSRGFKVLEVGLPSESERKEFIDFLQDLAEKDASQFARLEGGFSREEMARVTNGMPLYGIERVHREAAYHHQPISRQQVREVKTETIRTLGQDCIQVEESEEKLDSVGGLEYIKSYLRAILPLILSGALSVPQAILFQGVPGVGKTQLARAIAGELGWMLVRLSLVRSMWQGETERRMRMVFNLINQLYPMVLFIDEIDQQFSQRNSGPSADSGTSERIFAGFLEWMGDLAHRGKVLIIGCTNRPDHLDSALLDRFGVSIPFLKPGVEELRDMTRLFLARFNRSLAGSSLDEVVDVLRPLSLSGRSLQEIIIHAGFLADREHGVRGSEVSREHLVRAAQDTLTRENVLEMEFLQLVALSLASRNSLLPWNDISGLRPGAEIPDWLLSLGVVEKSGRLKEPRLYEVLNQMRHRHLAQRMAA